MSQLSRGIFAALAISLTCGAVQLASGRDLTRGPQSSVNAPQTASNISINRTAKADRLAPVAGSAVSTQTISLRLDALADTSILVRMPAAKEARNGSEPVVSVLTEVAKLLQPGRCVT